MKFRLKYAMRNNIIAAVGLAIAIALCVWIGYQWWVIPIFVGALYLICSLQIEPIDKKPWTVIPFIWEILLFVLGAALTTFSVQRVILENELFIKMKPEKWWLNFFVILAFYLIVQLFTNRVWLSCIISHVFLTVFGFVDYFMYTFRQNEFTVSDFKAMKTGFSVLGNYEFQFMERQAYIILASILFVAFVLKWTKLDHSKRLRMSAITAALAIACIIFVGVRTSNVNTETWEKKGTYRNGYILNFMLGVRDSFVAKPEGYSADKIAELETKFNGDGSSYCVDAPEEKPTVIVIMSESFADLQVVGEFETNVELTPFIDSLKENTLRGYALASIYGAKTANSEWEYLTGNTMAFLPGGSVVYQQYINNTPASLVSTMKNHGYTCVAMHPYFVTGWSRNVVYPNMGFDEMYFIDDFDQTKLLRKYVTDAEMFDKIIERYENRPEGEDLFLFGVTMQNHGGYVEEYENFEQKAYKIGDSYTDANQYMSLIHESDKAVEDLITYFSNVDEPVEIVFFGDHQPSLSNKFIKLLNGKGLSGLDLDELQNLYTVPFFIWTNYDTPEEEIEMTSLNYLSTLTLERAGIALPAYNQFLAEMMKEIPAINSQGYYSINEGKYLHMEDAPEDEAQWIADYRILQYNAMFDKRNRSDIFAPYAAE